MGGGSLIEYIQLLKLSHLHACEKQEGTHTKFKGVHTPITEYQASNIK